MNYISLILHNHVLMAAATGWLSAQVLKTMIYGIINKEFRAERLVGAGGMPSAHAATVCALATGCAFECGIDSPIFAVALFLAIIVMYDARGVRRETGLQAEVINEMMEFFKSLGQNVTREERLKELVGHTPLQVLMGGILGVSIALLYCVLL